jgi:CRISPR-associated protein Csd1
MTILQALNHYYDRMALRGEAEPEGYSREKISFAIVLSPAGDLVDVVDLRQMHKKKLQPRLLDVPAAVKRTVAILPNFLWDKTAYVLGRTAGNDRRTAEEHAAFKALHLKKLASVEDEGLKALRLFLAQWQPGRFDQPPFMPDMLDTNGVFQLEGENAYIHDRAAARHLLERRNSNDRAQTFCLVTGERAPVCRLHPTIKGVDGAQTSGAALVSFNLDAFTSYGKEQGDNAPTSEAAAFRYGAALNRLLDRNTSRNRIKIGDTTVVFWADASETSEQAATEAEALFASAFAANPSADDDSDMQNAAMVRDALQAVARGRPVRDGGAALKDLRFHILGLAPNAARLSVRFWLEGDFQYFARRLNEHYRDLDIVPPPWRVALPSVQRLLVKTTALQEKFENIPPLLTGEMMRAVLNGGSYPRTLMTTVLMRLRAGDDPGSGWHAAAIRAVLARAHRLNFQKEDTPVTLDKDNPSAAYQLGRLFAALETAQRYALGKVNATIRDRYFGTASSAPAGVFALLLRGAQSHLGKLRKERRGQWLEREIEEIVGHLPGSLPRSLALEDQGRFAVGYYHQRRAQFADRPTGETDSEGDDNDDK